MDPITAALLGSVIGPLVSGTAGEAGKSAWSALTSGIRRILGSKSAADQASAELAAVPEDGARVAAMAEALTQAATRPEFEQWLRQWLDDARPLVVSDNSVTNTVSGQVNGPVVQARDIHGPIVFGQPPAG